VGWFACVLENLAFSVIKKMDTARLFELMADCPIIVHRNHQRSVAKNMSWRVLLVYCVSDGEFAAPFNFTVF